MAKGTVLVVGACGVGKSTLINAILGEEAAMASGAPDGTTNHLAVYDRPDAPFRLIDTVGFAPGWRQQRRAVQEVRRWGKSGPGRPRQGIDVIWFCLDGTSRKLFARTVAALSDAIRWWPSVPLIAVITKSYSRPERGENTAMVQQVFSRLKRPVNLQAVIPVVARPYVISDQAVVPVDGLDVLVSRTLALMPQGMAAGQRDLEAFWQKRRRLWAQSLIVSAAAAGAVVGAVPIPFSDALILQPVETAEVYGLARLYGIQDANPSNRFLNAIIQAGTVGTAAKALISAIKAIPGLTIATSALNAAMAAAIILALGEASQTAFEQVALGRRSLEDIDWVNKLVSSRLARTMASRLQQALTDLPQGADAKTTAAAVLKALFTGDTKHEA
jgi:uncharacterized protein (DUF697 family)